MSGDKRLTDKLRLRILEHRVVDQTLELMEKDRQMFERDQEIGRLRERLRRFRGE